ncbi:hypothetical protein [Boseongicola sp. H5]|uniref:hypothetical protein n=1 Tax=Boseongicola sp. H5 TaxID=2763261 RepID=UPI001D0A0E72|nr:hypothetical protein [Boseongicola sp. H5]
MSDDPAFSEREQRRHIGALKDHLRLCLEKACAEALVADALFAAPEITIQRNAEQPILPMK